MPIIDAIRSRAIVFVLFFLGAGSALADGTYRLTSPDKRIQVTVEMPAAGSTQRPHWSATLRGKPILTGCQLGLQTADAGDLMAGVQVKHARERSINQRVPVLFGKADHANDRFHEIH